MNTELIDDLMTASDLARRLRISPRTIRRLRACGELPTPCLLIGRTPRWRPAVIARWLETRPRIKAHVAGARP